MHLEHSGGTFEKTSFFQSNHAWVIKFDMVIPFKKLIWANRLSKRSYEQQMDRLGLPPAEWMDTYHLKDFADPAYQKSEVWWDIPKAWLASPPSNADLANISPISSKTTSRDPQPRSPPIQHIEPPHHRNCRPGETTSHANHPSITRRDKNREDRIVHEEIQIGKCS